MGGYIIKPASKIYEIIKLIIGSDLELRIEGRSIETFKDFRELNKDKRWMDSLCTFSLYFIILFFIACLININEYDLDKLRKLSHY